MYKKLGKEPVIGLDIQHLHHLSCDCISNGGMFLHQGTNLLISSIHIVMNVTYLKT